MCDTITNTHSQSVMPFTVHRHLLFHAAGKDDKGCSSSGHGSKTDVVHAVPVPPHKDLSVAAKKIAMLEAQLAAQTANTKAAEKAQRIAEQQVRHNTHTVYIHIHVLYVLCTMSCLRILT